MRFADCQVGDVLTFSNLVSNEPFEKIGPHAARVVNSSETRNVGDDEPVYVQYAIADRHARLRAEGIPYIT